ncbi:peptidase M23 [Nostoc linckia z18]|jgi:murein DD-endopeptidase MepM/ murein hydrolase activator NlpD|uniref:Peptidase M23 n=2 Tax=Nostoc linckia TaxID=92942 RepID=A0A9Q6EJB4_NOSLI|nr:M23 family metallopeptidase [Nostoc linckia]PHK41127.1 peptidase M23 [Nostoc linckia z15]PHK44872.1 peptidase M23 [Nostoc linckia z16]PHJ58223.1 peptidase M23 [Nostoc linckia z1]PHJ64394.1 peptidase M23 [Nostoc linckia z2]PHJ65064.1 peptidase M23 [Nostoc linckia z3]
MTQRKNSAHHRLHYLWQRDVTKKRFASTLPAQGLCWLSSVSILSGGFVSAQTETQIDNIVPTVESSQPTVVFTNPVKKQSVAPEAAQTQPDFAQRRARLRQRLRNKPEVAQSKQPIRQSQPKIEAAEPVVIIRQSKPKPETSQIVPARVRQEKPNIAPRPLPEKLPEVAQPTNNSNSAVRTAIEKARDYNNAYIDPNSYDTGTTGTYQAPSSVILTERSSGCRATLSSGQNVSGGVCVQAPQTGRVANSNGKSAPNWLRRSQNAQLPVVAPVRQVAAASNNGRWGAAGSVSASNNQTGFRPNRFIPSPNEFSPTRVSTTPIAPSGGTLPPPMADGNLAPRPSTVSYDFSLASVLPQIPYSPRIAYGGTGMMYPLSIPASITSVFGWRIHPITGNQRFHAGTDLGAPTGTPILAAAGGQVETANWLGGYGLAVIINHKSAQQTLYGHMSEIFVQPGQWVEPGTVIGRVGSTGNSTGPHLHFEVRHLTPNGWVATDPGVQLQSGLAQLLQSLRTAQVSQQPGS